MKASAAQKSDSLKEIVIRENPDLDRLFGDRVLFPDKNRVADLLIRQHGLPAERGRSVEK